MSVSLETQATFATTNWSVVLAAGETGSPESQRALDQLCRAYWFPLYAYLRRRGHSSHDAQDLVQDFLAQLIERRAFRRVAPNKGRFRSFLAACLNHYAADAGRRDRAQKRGGNRALLSLDSEQADQLYALEAKTELTAGQLLDRQWALEVMRQALGRLGSEQKAAGKDQIFERLRPFLTDSSEACDYRPIAAQLQFTPNAVAVAVSRLRSRYRELVRAEVAATVADSSEVDAEMQYLLTAMRA